MDLPIPTVPIHTLRLPSGKEVRVRPFLVKEEKLLLMAAQTKDANELVQAVERAVTDCLIDKDVKFDKLSFFDVDYLMVALRAKSIAPTIDVQFRCRSVTDEGECGHIFTVPLDIANSQLVKEDISDKIALDDKMGMKLKYPKYGEMKRAMMNENEMDRKIRLFYNCTDYIYNGDEIHSMKDYSLEQFSAFVDALTDENFKKLEYWTDHLPRYVVYADQTCPKCGTHHHLHYEDMNAFFLS